MLPTCLWDGNEKKMNTLRITIPVKWGDNLISFNWQALSGSLNSSPVEHACDWNGGDEDSVSSSILFWTFSAELKCKPKLIASSSKSRQLHFSAVTTAVHLLLHLCQVRQIFTEPGTASYTLHLGDKQKDQVSTHSKPRYVTNWIHREDEW